MGTTISCRFSAPTLLLLILVATPGRVPFAASAPQQTQQPASPPIAPVPQVAPKPKPKAPQKPAPAPPKFPSAVKWSVIVDAAPVAPPLVAESRVILALRSGTLSARLLTDGTEAWTVKLAVDQPLAAEDDKIFVVAGETLHALNAADGSSAWKAEVGKPSAPILARGGWVIVAGGGSVTALRAADGETIWSKSTGAISERPAIDGDGLYLPIAEGRLIALDLKTGNVRWDLEVGASPTEPLAYGDRVYFGSDSKRFVSAESVVGSRGMEMGGRDAHHRPCGRRRIARLLHRDGQHPSGIEPRQWRTTLGVPSGLSSNPGTGRHRWSGRSAGHYHRAARAGRGIWQSHWKADAAGAAGDRSVVRPAERSRWCAGRRHDLGRVDEPMDRVGVDA